MNIGLSLAQVEYDEECRQKRRHKNWVADVNRRRRARGEFFNLVQELRTNDPERHRTYFRMSRDTLDLLSKIGPTITRQRTNFREPIDAAQRLAVTLRYMATGMEFSALAPTYRLGDKTIRAIVYATLGRGARPPSENGETSRTVWPHWTASMSCCRRQPTPEVSTITTNTPSALFSWPLWTATTDLCTCQWEVPEENRTAA